MSNIKYMKYMYMYYPYLKNNITYLLAKFS